LLGVHERYRQLIAYEIHDGLVQLVTGALMALESYTVDSQSSLNRPDADSLENVVGWLREAVQEGQRLIGGLGPPVLFDSGLVPAINHLLAEVASRGKLEIEFSHHVQFLRVARPLEVVVFRIIQEALTNAEKHSDSEKVRLSLVQQGNEVQVEVRDWGVGFNPEQVDSSSFGLRGIRERARLFGGWATIDSSPTMGTQIIVGLPLVEEGPQPTVV
jgi:signal transduction histidine kinase